MSRIDFDENCTYFQDRLMECIKNGENNEAKLLLQKLDYLCDLTDNSGSTLLHYAVKYNNASMVQHLISEGCDVNAQDPRGITPLMMALNNGDATMIAVLLKNNVDICATVCMLPLIVRNSITTSLSLERKKYQVILKLFFDKLCAVFLADMSRLVELLINVDDCVKLAAAVFGTEELMNFMLQINYEINYREPQHGYTALHYAIVFARVENAKMLIQCGADVNMVDGSGRTALHYYSVNCESADEGSEVLKYLLKCANNSSGLRLANLKHLIVNGSKRTVQAVLQSDIDVNSYISDKMPLAYLLVDNKNSDVLEVLDEVDIKFDVNAKTSIGDTALMAAIEKKCLRKVDFLLDHGADNLDSALFYAIMISNLSRTGSSNVDAKIAELLLLNGANPQAVSRRGDTIINSLQHHRVASEHSRVILAHLALLESLDDSPLTDLTREEIQSNSIFKAQFDSCAQQLEEMKAIKVHGEVTLFKLLTEKYDKLVVYAGNRQLILAFKSIMKNVCNLEPYYSNALYKRMAKAISRKRLALNAAPVVEALTGICCDVHRDIVSKIISYVNLQDLRNLCKIEYIIVTME